jgi:hypothetical protein
LWTLAPHLVAEDDGSGDGVIATDASTGWRLEMHFLSQHPPAVRLLRGSLEPFGGWVMNGPQPTPSASYEVTQEPGSRWVATIFSLVPPGTKPGSARPVIQYNAEDDWSVSVNAGPRAIAMQRRHDQLFIDDGGAAERHIGLMIPSTESLAERNTIQKALAGTLREFQRFQPYLFYRLRLSYALGATALISMGALYWWRRRAGRLPSNAIALALLFWIAAAAWIRWVYFAA